MPWLAGWDLDEVSAEDRKTFEVAVHGGAALALLIGQRRLIADELGRLDARRIAVIALSFLPAVGAGLALEDVIDRRLGGPRATAAGLIAGSVAMVARRPCSAGARRRRGDGARRARDRVRPGGGAGAGRLPQRLDPGRRPSARLRPRAGEPALADRRPAGDHRRRGPQGGCGCGAARSIRASPRAATVGVGVAFASTLASQGLIRVVERDRALWPYAAYRVGLAG